MSESVSQARGGELLCDRTVTQNTLLCAGCMVMWLAYGMWFVRVGSTFVCWQICAQPSQRIRARDRDA